MLSKSLLPKTVEEGFTQSEITTADECGMKWNLKYNHLLQKPDSYSFPLMVGHVLHDAWEQIYKTGFERYNIAPLQYPEGAIPSLADTGKYEYWTEVIPAMLKAYVHYWKGQGDLENLEIISLEEEISIEFLGFILRGKIDMTIRSRKIKSKFPLILDHKSSAKLDRKTVVGFDFRFQFLFYLWLKWKKYPKTKFYGYAVNMMKKPEIRPTQKENLQTFAHRVFTDMLARPEMYFYREYYNISLATLQRFELTVVVPKIERFRLGLEQPDLFPLLFEEMNTNHCDRIGYGLCEFIDICRFGFDQMGHLYRTQDHKHPELDNE